MLVAIAYRWGQINNHNYLISATTGSVLSETYKLKIQEEAESVHQNRGGKYGVTIWLVSEAGEPYMRKILKHYSSSCKEEMPYETDEAIDPRFIDDIQDEISSCDAQYHIEKNAGNVAKEHYWSGKKTGLRWAVAFLKAKIGE